MKPKHSIVREYILSKILNGTFEPHQKINSESELMEKFHVSRHTVRQAIGDLVTQGWLYSKQGSGTFCADKSKRQTKTSDIKNIAIITTYISDYIFSSIIRGAESYLSRKGYNVSLFSTNNNYQNEKEFLERVLILHPDGVIIEPTKSALSNPNLSLYLNLEKLKIPYIMINAYYDELEPVSITIDDEKGGYLQTKHLIELGHENIIGFFKTDDLQGTRRMKGYLKALREHSIPINPKFIITFETSDKMTKPVEKLNKLLSQENNVKPTGIVCYNDELAILLLNLLREKKIVVPDEISIVGYDDSFLAEASEVKLTTIEHPKIKMGEDAAKMIIDLVENVNESQRNNKLESIVYEPKLILRTSTKHITKKI
ncbi:GntR family transcriptional regulator [Pseudogracilibacillus sp. SE30717A]|uniref:GntR family transcriptional regulator n=1 Tax=Pseudogracilibacillus sp. SE30717A TaxID=3098293 RepID=UPI00300E5BF2